MARGHPKQTINGGTPPKSNGNGAKLGFEAQLFLAADKLRKNLEPSDYKHVALGLIFLKHISLAFEASGTTPCWREDPAGRRRPDEYLGRECLLGAQRGALVAPAGQCQAAHHRQAHR